MQDFDVTSACIEGEQCCPLIASGPDVCNSETNCTVDVVCAPIFDDCFFGDSDQAVCESRGGCSFNATDGTCKLTDLPSHQCSAALTPEACSDVISADNGLPLCQQTDTCVDNCVLCDECVDAFAPFSASQEGVTSATDIAAAFTPFCTSLGYTQLECGAVASLIQNSLNGNLGKRPAAICTRLNECPTSDVRNCTITAGSDPTELPLDQCTLEGVEGGTQLPGVSNGSLPEGSCRSDADCPDPLLCDSTTNSTSLCTCVDGTDSCETLGTCVDICDTADVQVRFEFDMLVSSPGVLRLE